MLGLVAAFRTAGRQLWQLTVQLLQRTAFLVLDFHLDNDWGNDWGLTGVMTGLTSSMVTSGWFWMVITPKSLLDFQLLILETSTNHGLVPFESRDLK
jgi:Na+-driven multidrug efflux pump